MRVALPSNLRAPFYDSFRVAPLIIIATIALTLGSVSGQADPSWAQDLNEEDPQPLVSNDLSDEEIERNEARLKILEEELLHTMETKPAEAPRKAPTKTSIQLQEESPFARTLREIADHPVLRGKPNRASSSVTSGMPSNTSDTFSKSTISPQELDMLQRKLSVSDAALVKELERNYGAKAVRTASTTTTRATSSTLVKTSTRSSDAGQGRSSSNEWTIGRTSPRKAPEYKRPVISPAVYTEVEPPRWINNQRTSAIASVSVDNASLHIGPGQRDYALSSLSKSAVVKIEKRRGEWYRVVTTNGNRGWLPGDTLVFNANVPRDSTVRVRAYQVRFDPMRLRF